MKLKRLFVSAVLASAALASGCVTMYRPDVAQGNLLTQDVVDTVRLDMTKRQVRFLLGSPSIADPFHPNRWDYVYAVKKGNGNREQRSLTLLFKDEKLARVATNGFSPPAGTELATAENP